MRRGVAMAMTSVVVATLIVVVASPMPADAAPVRTFTYSLSTKGEIEADVFEFAAIAAQVLNDPGGWSLGGTVRFEAAATGGEFVLVLASPGAIAATSRSCSDDFSCRVGNQVLINDLRWRVGAAPYTGTLDQYRSYVISHEVGHWLGFGHAVCGGPGRPAPIMVQQSKGLGGCTPTTLPSDAERRLLAERLGLAGSPFGSLDVIAAGHRTLRVSGWAIDPDDAAPIEVHIYVGGQGVPIVADASRPDVAAVHPEYGDRHGFDVTLPLDAGLHHVCAYAIDRGGVVNTTLGCVVIDHASPFGSLDAVELRAGGTSVRVAGWAIDPHSDEAIDVHVYVDGNGYVGRANISRPDITNVLPTAGPAHAFDVDVPVPPDASTSTVCAYAIDVGGGSNSLLGCSVIQR